MMRPFATLGGAVLALALVDGWLVARERSARATDVRVGALFAPEEAERLRKVPALRVDRAGTTHRYGRIEGQWRCLSYHDAPADGRGVQGLLDALVQAEGFVLTREVDEAARYGINTPETIRIALQGPRAVQDPSGDVQAEIDVGASLSERGETYLRRKGTKEVWSVDGDVRALLEPRGALPPLLEPSAVPAPWLEKAGGVLRVEVVEGARRLALERRDAPFDADALERGASPWSWILDPEDGTGERELDVDVAGAYATWLEQLAYVDVLEPERRAALVPDPPPGLVVLYGREGVELRLAFGAPLDDGRVPLWVADTATLYLLSPGARELALPATETLATGTREQNAWSAALSGGGR